MTAEPDPRCPRHRTASVKPQIVGARVNAGVQPRPYGHHWHCILCDEWGTGGRVAFEYHYLDSHWNPTDGDTD